MMSLEQLSGEQIVKVELNTGEPIVYEMDENGKVLSKKVFAPNK